MFRYLILVANLLVGPTAFASAPFGEGGGSAPPNEVAAAHLAVAAKPKGPEELLEEKQEEKSEAEKAAEERIKAIEAAESQKLSRVVVLKWPESDTDHNNETLQRNIKTRIARPDAKFYPEIDLYQSGRKELDKSVSPGNQRAVVPAATIDKIAEAVARTSTIPWDALSEQDWGMTAHELRALANEVWFLDRVELREPLFSLYAQIGKAAENSNNPSPPFFAQIGDKPVNLYWFLAGSLANEEPGLMSKVTDQDMYASINYYKEQLDRKEFPMMTLSFELEGEFDAKEFAGEYQVFINGLPKNITSKDGLWEVNPGISDVYLARADGHSLSDRVTLEKMDGKVYFVRNNARARMGKDFIDMLMEHPNECTPEVAGDILTYLSIYAKLHPQAEIYIGLAKGGSISSRNIYLWRWDRVNSNLQKVLDDTGGFPVRFVGLVGTGLIFNTTASVEQPDPTAVADAQAAAPDDPSAGLDAAKGAALESITGPSPVGLPVFYHLRGHYGRLMVTVGMEYTKNLTDGPWTDAFQTDSKKDPENNVVSYTEEVTVTCPTGTAGADCDPNQTVEIPILREREWQRLVFLGVGGVLGRNAAIGFGPRGWIRTGWYNAPHAIDLTAHVGYAMLIPYEKATGRVRPIADLDLYGGMMIPFRDSIFVDAGKTFGAVKPTIGTALSVGITF